MHLFKSYHHNYDEYDAHEAFLVHCKAIYHRLACENSTWNGHIHFGHYDKFTDLGLPIPYQEVTDHTMAQRTWDARKQFMTRLTNGHELTPREKQLMERADNIHDRTVRWQARTKLIKHRVNAEADAYLN